MASDDNANNSPQSSWDLLKDLETTPYSPPRFGYPAADQGPEWIEILPDFSASADSCSSEDPPVAGDALFDVLSDNLLPQHIQWRHEYRASAEVVATDATTTAGYDYGSVSQHQDSTFVNHSSTFATPAQTQGYSQNEQQGCYEPFFHVSMSQTDRRLAVSRLHSDPWSPEAASERSPYRGNKQNWPEMSSTTGQAFRQDRFSASDAQTPSTRISSNDSDVGGMDASMMTVLPTNEYGHDHLPGSRETEGHIGGPSYFSISNTSTYPYNHMMERYLDPVHEGLVEQAGHQSLSPHPQPQDQSRWLLGTPSSHAGSTSMSRSPSNRSNTGTSICEVCEKAFHGEYRRGNLARHRRQKHAHEEQTFPCEKRDCPKTFKRQDARLKHYRREHPELASNPPMPRKFESTSPPGGE